MPERLQIETLTSRSPRSDMKPHTLRLHLAFIKLAKGAIKAWEEWALSHRTDSP